MARRLTPQEVYEAIAKRSGYEIGTVRRIYDAIVGFSVEELRNYSFVCLPTFVTLTAKLQGDKEFLVPTRVKGEQETIYIEPCLRCNAKLADGFKKAVNGKYLTQEERRKAREDLYRQRKAEEQALKDEERRASSIEAFEFMREQKKIRKQYDKLSNKKKKELREKELWDFDEEYDEEEKEIE